MAAELPVKVVVPLLWVNVPPLSIKFPAKFKLAAGVNAPAVKVKSPLTVTVPAADAPAGLLILKLPNVVAATDCADEPLYTMVEPELIVPNVGAVVLVIVSVALFATSTVPVIKCPTVKFVALVPSPTTILLPEPKVHAALVVGVVVPL